MIPGICITLAVASVLPAGAATLLSTGFESPTYSITHDAPQDVNGITRPDGHSSDGSSPAFASSLGPPFTAFADSGTSNSLSIVN